MVDEINKRVQQPRNTTAVNDAYVGPPGQFVIDVERWEIRLHDGRTQGGWRFPNLSQLLRMFISSDSEMGEVVFPDESRGLMARTNNKTYRLRNIVGADGITIDNADGAGGNPTINLPQRLEEQPTLQTNLDGLQQQGFYSCDKAATSMPAGMAGVSHGALTVHVGTSPGDGLMILQEIIALNVATNTIYRRRYTAGVWSAWA